MPNKKNNNKPELNELEEQLTSSFPVAFCVINNLNVILETNDALEELTDYKKPELIGMSIKELFLEKGDIETFLTDVSDNQDKQQFTLLSKNQNTVFVRVSMHPRKNDTGDVVGYLVTFVDISNWIEERTRLTQQLENKEEELETKTQRMADSRTALLNILEDVDQSYKQAEKERTKTSAIIENLIDGMFFFDAENHLAIANSQTEEFFDVQKEEIVGRTLRDLSNVSELNMLIDFIKKDEEEEIKDLYREELHMEEEFYLEITTSLIEDDEGKVLGKLVHIHDISREKRIERIKSEFVSVAAHQLRTPLSGIKWTLENLKEGGEDRNLAEEELEIVEKAYESNERMINLVDDLLNVSRIEEGRYVYDTEVVDIRDLLQPIVEDYQETIEGKEDLQFNYNIPEGDLPEIQVDTEKLGIVIQNFLDNAMKYTDKGEITLSVTQPQENKLRVAVQDEGVGIPEEEQERLFDKFFRADNVMRKDTEGSGLGLFIAHNIIEAHEGELDFESTEGEGSIFYFTLPTVEGDQEG